MRPIFCFFLRVKRQPQAWWSSEVEGAVSVRRKAFAAAHRIDEDRQVYISAFRHASSVITKSKAEAWQATYLSLSSKSVYSILRSVTVFFLIFLLS